MAATPNMLLVLPVEGGSSDIWDIILDTAFGLIDAHDHTTSKGVRIPAAALNINADVPWATHAATGLLGAGFTESAATAVASYVDLLFVNSSDHNLYFRNQGGSNVQVTSGNTLNISIVGGIGGDYASVGALFSYDDATRRYLAQQEGSPRPWAGIATGDIDLYQKAVSISNKVTLKSPAALAASYSVTLPPAVPLSSGYVFMDGTGAISVSQINPVSRVRVVTAGQANPGTTAIALTAGAYWNLLTYTGTLSYPVICDISEKVLSWTLYVRKTSATGTITAQMQKIDGATGTVTGLSAAITNSANNPGFVTLTSSTTCQLSSATEQMFIAVTGGGTTGDTLFGATIQWQLLA